MKKLFLIPMFILLCYASGVDNLKQELAKAKTEYENNEKYINQLVERQKLLQGYIIGLETSIKEIEKDTLK